MAQASTSASASAVDVESEVLSLFPGIADDKMQNTDEHTEEDPSCLKKMGNDQYASQLFTGLNQLRKESSFCDVTIIVGEQRFPAHKAVLSCASSYFQGMFSAGFQESSMSEVTVAVPGSDEGWFAQLLEFAYTGHFNLSLKTATKILRMACYMMQVDAMKVCANYLKEVKPKLSLEECFEVWSIAINHDVLKDLVKRFQGHLVANFPECGRSSVFLENASADVLLQMLVDVEIETDGCGEEQIVEVVLAWLKYDWEHRHTDAAALLKKLRLGLLPLDKLQELLGEEVLSIPECKAMVEEVRRLDATKEEADVPLIQSHPDTFASRNTVTGMIYYRRKDNEFVCHTTTGCYELYKLNMYHFPFEYHSSDKRLVLWDIRSYDAKIVDSDAIYVASGPDNQPPASEKGYRKWLQKNNFFKYDLRSNKWVLLDPMKKVMMGCNLRIYKIGDYIHAISEDYNSRFFVQRYSLTSERWEDCIPLTGPRMNSEYKTHVVIGDHILWRGCKSGDGYYKAIYKLYNSRDNSVVSMRVIGNDHPVGLSHLHLDHNTGVLYLMIAMTYRNQGYWELRRISYEFDAEEPNIWIEDEVDREASIKLDDEAFEQVQKEDPYQDKVTVTFDRRALQMDKDPVHVEKRELVRDVNIRDALGRGEIDLYMD